MQGYGTVASEAAEQLAAVGMGVVASIMADPANAELREALGLGADSQALLLHDLQSLRNC